MNIYIVRHGQVDSNIKKVYNIEEDLNQTGIQQAEELRNKIEKERIPYDVIISSPLSRAKHTASIINYQNKNILVDERLKERDPGSLTGQSFDTTNREEYWNYYATIQYGTAETMQHLFARVHDFLDELKTKEYTSVLIAAHSGISKAFYAYFHGIPEDGKFLNLGLKNGEIKKYVL